MVPIITKDNFSRVRGKSHTNITIVKRGNWSHNHIFSKCTKCGGMCFYKICQHCDNIDLVLNPKQKKLMRVASKKHRVILPCVDKCDNKRLMDDFNDCFTVQKDKTFFWFNDQENSSRLVHG